MRKMGAIIILLFFVVINFSGIGRVGAEEKKYLNIGANPVAPKQFNPATEDIYSLSQDVLMEIGQKGGKRVRGYAQAGTKVVVPKGDAKIIRIYECGNPVFNEVYVAIGKLPLTTLVAKEEDEEDNGKMEDNIDLYRLPPATQERIERESKPIEKSERGGDVVLKIVNCASSMAIGWGLQSSPKRDENFAIGGVAGLVISYSLDREITFGDVLTTVACGAIGALVAPAQPSSGSVASQPPASSPPPSGGSGEPVTPPPVPSPSGGSTSSGSGGPVIPPLVP